MHKWNINEINQIEKTPTSPAWLQQRFTDILYHSTSCRCKVELTNPTTGEYRIVLQGTLDPEPHNPGPNYN